MAPSFGRALERYRTDALADLHRLEQAIKEHLQRSELQLLRSCCFSLKQKLDAKR